MNKGKDNRPREPFDEKDWTPVVSTVDGRVPGTELQSALSGGAGYGSVVALYAATQFQTTRSGPVNFNLTGGNKAFVWIDGKPISNKGEIRTELAAGTHSIVVRLEARQLPDQLSLRSVDVNFLAN